MEQFGSSFRKTVAVIFAVAIVVFIIGMVKRHSSHTVVRAVPAQSDPLAALSMPDLLKVLYAKSPPIIFLSEERAKIAGAAVESASDLPTRMNAELTYAQELLNAGRSADALAEYNLIDRQTSDGTVVRPKGFTEYLLLQKAITYLRIAEQQNCCSNNNSDSCLIPIRGKGVHTLRYGSTHAVECLTQLLQRKPGDVTARWLINIAYMTLGEYPSGVPAQWRIDPKVYGGEYPMKRFYNAAPELGLAVNNWAGGAAMEDFEGNGLLDIMISSMRPDGQLLYFHNNGDGTFTDRTKEAGLIGETGALNFVTTDYNNDGRPDVLLLRGGWVGAEGHLPVSLLRNDGNGHFTDVTRQCGLIKHMMPTQTAAWFDYNGDGNLDLFIGNETTTGDPCPSELWRNNGDGTFTDVTKECGLDIRRYVKAVVSADFNRDGRPDLYISCDDGPNILLRNDGPAGPDKSPDAPWKFTDVAHQAGVDKQQHSFSCFFFDYNNDGWPDLYVNGYSTTDVAEAADDYLGLPTTAERARLYRNNHDGTFTDVTKEAHLYKVNQGMGINFGDLDNDGWLDFYVGTGNPDLDFLVPKRMFRNNGGKYFQEVTTTGDFGHLQKGHGIAFGDINNNGQEDVFLETGGAYTGDTAHSCLFVNPGNSNHWVTLKLVGVRSNRVAIGAETCVTVRTPHGERNIYETVGSGGSFGCNPFRQHFGLGDATSIEKVTIHWPASGITQTVTNVGMDRFWQIREGDPTATPMHVKTFPLPHGDDGSTTGISMG